MYLTQKHAYTALRRINNMKTVQLKIFSFDELSEKAQAKALEKLHDLNIDHEWWDCIYSDAVETGLMINEFNLYPTYAKGKFLVSGKTVAQEIKENHGTVCETRKTAENYLTMLQELELYHELKNTDPEYDFTDTREFENALEDLDKDFLHELLGDYAKILEQEFEYRTSRESIIETIQANDYQFFENGGLYHG